MEINLFTFTNVCKHNAHARYIDSPIFANLLYTQADRGDFIAVIVAVVHPSIVQPVLVLYVYFMFFIFFYVNENLNNANTILSISMNTMDCVLKKLDCEFLCKAKIFKYSIHIIQNQ